MEEKKIIALDTSFLISAIELKIDVFEEIKKTFPIKELVIPIQVKKELDGLKQKSEKMKKQVILIEKMLEENNVKTISTSNKKADEALLEFSGKAIIATNDMELRQKIKQKKQKTIFIRKKKLLGMD